MGSWFTRGFGAAIADVRQRVIEEPYFGRVVTPRTPPMHAGAPGEKTAGDALGWFQRSFEPDSAQAIEAASPERDRRGHPTSMER